METWMITGVNGFLGPRIVEELRKDSGKTVLAMSRKEMDFTDEESVKKAFEAGRPDVLVHAGAISDTRACELDPKGSRRVNVDGVKYLARAAKEWGTKLIFTSSDQVYTGSDTREPHRETEELSPANVYGREKLEAERLIMDICPDGISLRLTWMYDLSGTLAVKPNFLTNLQASLKKGETLSFSRNDYRGLTDGRVVAERITRLKNFPGGVYNFGSPNGLDFYETACETVKLLKENPKGKILEDLGEKWRNLAFSTEKLEQAGFSFPDTLAGIRDCLARWNFQNNFH